MALVLKDRVKETTTTTGTGTVTLAGASTGYQAFSAVGNGNTTYYVITDPATGAWEVGLGTYTASGTTLSRDTVLSSSNAGSLVNFAAGTKEVFCAYPAEKAVYEEANGETLIDGGPITVIGNGVTSIPSLPAELGKFVGNANLFTQIYCMNQNTGTSASADFVAYNNLTTDGYTNFIDMGINSSNYTSVDYPIFTPGSGYLFHDGDHLFIGTATSNKDVVIFTGGVDTPNEAMRILGTDQSVELVGNLSVGGTLTVTGAAEFDSTVLLSADPTLALQAATKQYVDNATSNGFHVHTPVLVATTGNLTATYNNGTSGVGATLTNSGTQVALSIDGVSLSVADRVLVWQQTTGLQNGVYVVTTVGSGSTNWVLTRSSDANTSSEGDPNSLGGGDYFFVDSGTTLGYHSFVCTNTGAITFGTTAITFSEFSSVPAYTGGTNISVSGSTISLTGTVAPTNGGTGVNTVTTGDLLYGSGTNTWSKLTAGSPYQSLLMGAGFPYWGGVALNQSAAVAGTLGATNGGTGSSTYVTGDTLYASATNTLSKLPGNTTTTTKYLKQTGTGAASQAPSWDTIAAADITSGTLAVVRGGTGIGSYAVGDLLYAATPTDLGKLADVPTGNVLLSGGTNTPPSYGKVVFGTHTLGTLAVAQGGTGATTLTGYVFGNGTGAMTASLTIPNGATTATATNAASSIVARDPSGNFAAGTITATLSGNATSATVAGSATNATNLAITDDTATATTVYPSWAPATTGNLPQRVTSTKLTFVPSTGVLSATTFSGAHSGDGSALTGLNASNLASGTVASARIAGSYTGITGVGTLAAGTWNGTAIGATYGGTGQTSYAVGDLLYASTTSALSKLADVATGNALISGGVGVAPSYGKIGLTTHITGTLATGNGGTGLTSFTSGGAVYASSTSVLTTGTLPVASGGTGTTTSTGTGSVVLSASPTFTGTVTAPTFSGALSGNASTATILKSVNTTATGTSTWNPQTLTYQAWGQSFTNSNISADSGDITYWLRASQYSAGGTEVCVMIDGDYYAGTGQYKVLHAGNYNSYAPTLTGTGASGTWGINISGNAATATSATSATTATTATNASILTTTNQGRTGGQGLVTVSSTADWSNYPIGYSAMFNAGQTATGTPSSNYGFFIKIANRDGGGGWGGIWSDYNGGDTYVGNTTVSTNYATWYKLLSSSNYNSYAPTLTGTGASGTWSINVTGSAGSATTATTATTATNLSGGTVSATTISATGGYTATSNAPFFLNANTVAANFTVPANYNAHSAGPITVNTGVTVTVSTGANWVIV